MILIVDNYDSFTYNLAQYVGMCGEQVEVRRNDAITPADVRELAPDAILLSPGPGGPADSGVCLQIGRLALDGAPGFRVPLFGVCLGHQALGQLQGARICRAERIMHGKASPVEHDGSELFDGMPNPFAAIRYHSLTIPKGFTPTGFVITALTTDDGETMAMRHESLPIFGVQFHPESVKTEDGFRIVENFVRIARSAKM